MNNSRHTPGAIIAAELITGLLYHSTKIREYSCGRKRCEGIADLIDIQTGAPSLIAALEDVLPLAKDHLIDMENQGYEPIGDWEQKIKRAEEVLSRVKNDTK